MKHVYFLFCLHIKHLMLLQLMHYVDDLPTYLLISLTDV